MDSVRVGALEVLHTDQAARCALLKKQGADKADIDAAVQELLGVKGRLREALQADAAAAAAAGQDELAARLRERVVELEPRPSGSGSAVKSEKRKKQQSVAADAVVTSGQAQAEPPLASSSSEAAGDAASPTGRAAEWAPEWAAEWAAFCVVLKNRDACLHWVLRLTQATERCWDDAPARLPRLALLRACLEELQKHAHADCRELGALAPRMLHTLDFELRHFLNIVLPIERKFSRGLRDDEFLVTTDDGRGHTTARRRDDEFLVTTDDGGAAAAASGGGVGGGAEGDAGTGEGGHANGDANGGGGRGGGEGGGGGGGTAHEVPLTIVCDHLRSAFNVGSVFRTAVCPSSPRTSQWCAPPTSPTTHTPSPARSSARRCAARARRTR